MIEPSNQKEEIKIKPLLVIGVIENGPQKGQLSVQGPLQDKKLCLSALGEAVIKVAQHSQEAERRIVKPRFHMPGFGNNGGKNGQKI